MEVKVNKLYNIYLAIVSFVSIIAVAITLGVVFTSVGKYFLISDEEYLQYRESYKLESCKNPIYPTEYDKTGVVISNTNIKPSTEEEIKKCEEKVRSEVHLSRAYDLKDMFITSFSWMVVFLVLFFFHYPKFLRIKKED